MEEADPTVPTPATVDDSETADEATSAAAGDIEAGSSVGRYIVLSTLGKGGSGVVYAAFDPRLDRKIALKLVQPTPRGHERLLREAQAMAQLSHPNVVAVHDVGTVGDRVFVAMELVEGGTLRQWQREAPRGWRDVVRMYLAAGAGLAAAHARGLVHRDFKPDNVLVGRDGSVRVVDFGLVLRADTTEESLRTPSLRPPLARALPVATADTSPAPPAPSTSTSTSTAVDGAGSSDHLASDGRLTHVGVLVGTPGYMAPEQFAAATTDARTDQFSFCVALYEGLYGQRPFAGKNVGELKAATAAGRIRPPVRGRGVPAHIHRAVERGLATDPARRWPSMDALLAELRRDQGRRWRRAAVAALAVLAAAATAAVVVQHRSRQARLCAGADALAARAWSPAIDAEVAAAFAATGLPHAGRAHDAVRAAMSTFRTRWATMREDACAATRIRGEQSEPVLTVRLSCLDMQLEEARSFAALMARGGRDVVQHAVEAAMRVPDVARCADVPALLEPSAVPADRAVRDRVDGLRPHLADARALVSAGGYPAARDQLLVLAAEARAIAYLPLEAEVLLELGRAQTGAGEYAAAEATLGRAEQLADEARHDRVRAAALLDRVEVTGRWLGHYAQAERDASRAAHVARRLRDRELEWGALDALSRVHGYMGRLAEAVAEGRRSVALAQELFGDGDLRLARAHAGLAIPLAEQGQLDEAMAMDRLALAISERALGDTHPAMVRLQTNIATNLAWLGRPAEALPIAERAADLARRAYGEAHPQLGLAENLTGYVLNLLGRHRDAIAANTRALAIADRTGTDSADAVYPLVGLGESWLAVGDAARALPLLERATRIAEALTLDAETMGACHFHLGRAILAVRGDRARARALVTRAIADFGPIPRLARQRAEAEAWLAAHGGR
jgi:tetratricopeptide (TPR) repeat protein/predicted Ser/Thr protein kinase